MHLKTRGGRLLVFFLLNLALAVFSLLFILVYARIVLGGKVHVLCVYKVLTHSYCPACGGTRAVTALWHFDFLSALKDNAYVVFFALFAVFYEIRTLVRILKNVPNPYWIPGWAGWGLLVLWGVFFLARNLLLLAGIDLAGDFLPPPF